MSTIDAEALYRVLLDQIRAAYGTAFAEPGGPRLAGIHTAAHGLPSASRAISVRRRSAS